MSDESCWFYSQLILSESTTRVAPYRDPKVAQGYKAALRRLFPENLQPTMRSELMSFASTDDCGLEALADKKNVDVHKCWYFHGQMYQLLQPIAIKILSQKADNLVFVHSNLRLTTHEDNSYKKGEAHHWDVEPESAELEAHFDALANDDGGHEQHRDVEADPEAASTNASGTVCASNLQQHNDDDLFNDF